ncbi:MAG TPA: 2-polyprenyl-3-methyl-6-methoxy-1,4-benzoquinone monooxygenase [Moraxellaceae bacterium]|nr:2-polyprenyl-3-methyl-6-methoxy-1,4-benzoquinone monooxygenase [Moraxellaceae bacterium]
MRRYTLFDRFITEADKALRTVSPRAMQGTRPSPAQAHADAPLTEAERRHVAGLMRINHTGEICAQALYQGQALTARLPDVRADMEQAAREEEDHLAWCEERVREMGSHTSLLNPLWYAMSFGIGAMAGAAGDKWSLGFVAETENQVCAHLQGHLGSAPAQDARTRAILDQMYDDEARHMNMAIAAGAAELPPPVKRLMSLTSKVMTTLTYRV